VIQRKRPINAKSIRLANHRANKQVETMRRRLAEFDQHETGKDGYCKFCSFIKPDPIGGAALTQVECGLCETVVTSPTTAANILCKTCAETNQLCQRCGADLDLTNRQTVYPFQKDASNGG